MTPFPALDQAFLRYSMVTRYYHPVGISPSEELGNKRDDLRRTHFRELLAHGLSASAGRLHTLHSGSSTPSRVDTLLQGTTTSIILFFRFVSPEGLWPLYLGDLPTSPVNELPTMWPRLWPKTNQPSNSHEVKLCLLFLSMVGLFSEPTRRLDRVGSLLHSGRMPCPKRGSGTVPILSVSCSI